jgi:hypothetical protein
MAVSSGPNLVAPRGHRWRGGQRATDPAGAPARQHRRASPKRRGTMRSYDAGAAKCVIRQRSSAPPGAAGAAGGPAPPDGTGPRVCRERPDARYRRRRVVLVSGAAEIACGAAALLAAVFPANVQMALSSAGRSGSPEGAEPSRKSWLEIACGRCRSMWWPCAAPFWLLHFSEKSWPGALGWPRIRTYVWSLGERPSKR